MKFFFTLLSCICISNFLFSQDLPIPNGELEETDASFFTFWTNQATDGSDANFSIIDNSALIGSTKALQIQVNGIGLNESSVQTKSNHQISIESAPTITVSFFAKASAVATAPEIKLCLINASDDSSVFAQEIFVLDENWKQFTHTFTPTGNTSNYQIGFRYLDANTTYFLDEVNAMPGHSITLNLNNRHQTVQGFGGGIKRRTDYLNALTGSKRDEVEDKVYKDLKINMIRFFIHHTIENNGNDNDDPNVIDLSNTSWNHYSGSPFFLGETLQRAINKSEVGIDHLIGNCNSAPGWMKVNGSHKRANEQEDVGLNTLEDGMENEFTEFIEIFLEGLNQTFNIDVTEVSITNEPDFLNTYESMNLTPEKLKSIIPILRNRLDGSQYSGVNIISPESARVNPGTAGNLTETNSAVSYITEMFEDPQTKSAVDVIATHTYYDSNHNADWASLRSVSDGKPVWVTESGNLKSLDLGMDDASNYIKWMTRGFNEGGMTAYMFHLLFDKHLYETPDIVGDKEGSSGLVIWDDSENVFYPKRYYCFKHFSNLSGKGFTRVSNTVSQNNFYVTSFINPDNNQLVVHVFNSSENTVPITLEIPHFTANISSFKTDPNQDFVQSQVQFENESRYFETAFESKSLTSFVFDISETMDNKPIQKQKISIYPNPTDSSFFVTGEFDEAKLSILEISGRKVMEKYITRGELIDISALNDGLYFVKINLEGENQSFKIIKN